MMNYKRLIILVIMFLGSCTNTEKGNRFLSLYNATDGIEFGNKNIVFYIPYPTCESCYIAITNKLKTIVPKEDQLIIVSDQRFNKAEIFTELELRGYDIIYNEKKVVNTTEYSNELIIPSIVLLNEIGVDTIIQVNSLNVDQVFDFVFKD